MEPTTTRRNRINCMATMNAALVSVFLWVAQAGMAQTLTVLHAFDISDGEGPYAGITRDAHGNLYGVTAYGGDLSCDLGGNPGCGVAFKLKKLNSNWIFSLLYTFPGEDHDFLPTYPSQLAIGPNGTVYGAQLEGGGLRQGVVYNLVPSPTIPQSINSPWSYNVLHLFGVGTDGSYPHKINFDEAGNIFGATGLGGAFNQGAVYELSPSNGRWKENILYSFAGGADGKLPKDVVFDEAGNLFGVTEQGGNSGCSPFNGCGTVFELTPSGSGWSKTILHSFQQDTEGGYPGPLMRDSSGNLFGLTSQNGPNGYGAIWELSHSNGGWVFSVLYAFTQQTVALEGPFAPVIDANGSLYGVNNQGGTNNCGGMLLEPCGNIYKLTPFSGGWTYTDVHDFAEDNNGCLPVGPVALDDAGNIYGATYGCGENDAGVVFEFTPSS